MSLSHCESQRKMHSSPESPAARALRLRSERNRRYYLGRVARRNEASQLVEPPASVGYLPVDQLLNPQPDEAFQPIIDDEDDFHPINDSFEEIMDTSDSADSEDDVIHVPVDHPQCPICQDSIQGVGELWLTRCQHMFHTVCVTGWLFASRTRNNWQVATCPMCRQPLFTRAIQCAICGSPIEGTPGMGRFCNHTYHPECLSAHLNYRLDQNRTANCFICNTMI